MEEVIRNWNVWNEDTDISVSIDVIITELTLYPASFQTAQFWRRQYKALSLPLVCQDCVVVDTDGYQVTVTTHPSLGTLTRLEDTCARVTGLMKVTLAGHKLLVITAWTDTQPIEKQFKRQLDLADYGDQYTPLCNPSTDKLNIWTAAHFQWPDTIVKDLPKKFSVVSLSSQFQYSYQLHNLRRLNLTWSTAGKVPPLLVRVLARSKERLILQQDNHRKPWMCLTNLLVADNSGYCIMTVWDNAVPTFLTNVNEGDILALERYSVGRMQPSHRKIIHNLAPKVRLALASTEIELKMNASDLEGVTCLHHGAVLDTVPPLLTCFATIHQLTMNRVSETRLVDIVGMVAWHGRWEREGAYNQGQYWVRVWLRLIDHSSFQSPTPSSINVKYYTDQASWDNLKTAMPGQVVILTNLLTVFQGEQFSHLESSNQTGLFTGEEASDSRFGDVEEVKQFRSSLDTHQDQFTAALLELAGLGGQFCCGLAFHQIINVLTTAESQIVNPIQLSEAIEKLQIYGSKRLLVQAKVVGLKLCQVNNSGDSRLVEEILPEPNDLSFRHTVGSETLQSCSLRKLISSFTDTEGVAKAAEELCFFNKKPIKEEDRLQNVMFRECKIGMATLILGDLRIHAIIEKDFIEELQALEASHYMLDCFRFEPRKEIALFDGVEFVVRHAATLMTGSQSDQTMDQSMDQSLLNTTQDVANALL